MKNLVIPGPITLRDDDGVAFQRAKKGATQPTPQEMQAGAKPITEDETYTFWSWLRAFVLRDEKFNAPGWDTWEQITRISQLKGLEEGAVAPVDDDDIKLMTEVAKKPTKAMYADGLVAVQFAPFIRALIAANEAKPAKPVADVDDESEEEAA
jgi:hypothetical protein